MEVFEGLTPELQSAVLKFCSHPTADALRRTITSWKEYSLLFTANQAYPDANTFYIYCFTMRRLMQILTSVSECLR